MAYLPGDEGEGGGRYSIRRRESSGKLPYTYPEIQATSLPTGIRNRHPRCALEFNGFNPQFEFGYGLSYTDLNLTI